MGKTSKKSVKKTGINEHKYIPNEVEQEHNYNIPAPDRKVPTVISDLAEQINRRLKIKMSYLRVKVFKNYSEFNVAAYHSGTGKFLKMLNDKGDHTDTFNYLTKILTFISLI